MKKTCIPYTKREDEIIINEVKNYPTNLLFAFKQAAPKLPERNAHSISMHWYQKLRKNDNTKAVTCGSEKGFTQNVKNVHVNDDGNLPDQNLKHYLFVVKELLNLPNKERKLIIQLFSGNITVNN